MANTIQLRRSATANAVPTTAQLALGELAINTFDGKLYLKKNNGTESVVEIGAGAGGASISVSDTAPGSPVNGSLWWNSTVGVLKIYYNDGTSNQWVDASNISAGGTVSYPQNTQNGDYTLVLADAGKHIYSQNTGRQIITIPTNASVAFPIGTLITVVNMGTTKIVFSNPGVSIFPIDNTVALSSAQIQSGRSAQLLKTGTNAWKVTFGTVITNSYNLNYLAIGGGGSGGRSNGGGGGAGGYVTNQLSAIQNTVYTITIGGGGTAASGTSQGSDGNLSSINTINAIGGGGGGTQNGTATGRNGGSGGGGAFSSGAGGTASSGQGFAGGTGGSASGNGGGGGGASAAGISADAGANQGDGGAGLASSITGTSVTRAGGGGAGGLDRRGLGGTGGGGNGAHTLDAVAGTANTGGGGGGGSSGLGTNSGAGGSGVVIISVPTIDYSGTTTGSPTVTTSGANTIMTFNASGSYTA